MLYRILSSIVVAISFLLLFVFSKGMLQFLTQLFTLALLTGLIFLFMVSLRVNKTPVITRYALLMDAEDSGSEREYTRIVTWVWAAFFFVLWLLKVQDFSGLDQSLGLVEGLFYVGSAILFVGEFYVRQLFLPAHRGASLWHFLSLLSQVSIKDVWLFDAKEKDQKSS